MNELASGVARVHRAQGNAFPALTAPNAAPTGLPRMKAVALTLSCLYLLFEVAFSARLLDAVGVPGRVDVGSVELWGRVLSGLAVTIMFWSLWLLPHGQRKGWKWGAAALWMGLSGLGIIGFVYGAQEAYVRWLMNGSTGEQRRAALWLNTVSAAVVDGRVRLVGVDATPELLSSPEGKAMLAFLPFAAGRMQNLAERAEPAVRAIIRQRVDEAMGSRDRAWREVWDPSRVKVVENWNTYARAVADHANEITAIPRRQADARADLDASLRAHGMRIGNVPAGFNNNIHNRVRNEIQQKGISVPWSWNPNDITAFDAAVDRKVRQEADAAWQRGFERRGGAVLPRGLTFQQFIDRADIQEGWRETIGLASSARLDPTYTADQWLARVWEVERRHHIDEGTARVMSGVERYADGGDLDDVGKKAVEAAVVPPIALVFSLVGAATHTAKVISAALALAFGLSKAVGIGIGVATAAGILAVPIGRTNGVLESEFFDKMESAAVEGWGIAQAAAMRWVMQAQPMAYPIGDGIRRTMLLGMTFGVQNNLTRIRAADEQLETEQPAPPTSAATAASPVGQPEFDGWFQGTQACGGIPVLAHRGARPVVENTLEALRAARSGGYGAAEIDIQRTSDGQWVLHHDAVTGRVVLPPNANVRRVNQVSSAEWRQARLKGVNGQIVGGSAGFFADAVAEAQAGGGRLEVEVKTNASCAQIDGALDAAAPLGRNVRWTSAYRGPAACLAARARVGAPGTEAGYVGLIVGPPESSLTQHDARVTTAAILAERFGVPSRERWNEMANRDFATPEGVARAASLLSGAPRRGIHLPASDIERHPRLIRAAADAGLRTTIYADLGDNHMAQVVRSLAREERGRIDALVIDGAVAPFCGTAFGR